MKEIIARTNAKNATDSISINDKTTELLMSLPDVEKADDDIASGVHSITMVLSNVDANVVNNDKFKLNHQANDK